MAPGADDAVAADGSRALDDDVRVDDRVGPDRHRVLDVGRRGIEHRDPALHQAIEDAVRCTAAAMASCFRSLTPNASRGSATGTPSTRAPCRLRIPITSVRLRAPQCQSVCIATVPSAAPHARCDGVCRVAPLALAGCAWHCGGWIGAVAAHPGSGRIGLRRMLGGAQHDDIHYQRSRGARAVDARARRVSRCARPTRMDGPARPAPEGTGHHVNFSRCRRARRLHRLRRRRAHRQHHARRAHLADRQYS